MQYRAHLTCDWRQSPVIRKGTSMRPEDIRELLRRRPFWPFRVLTTNNLSFEIRHPELVAVSRSVLHLGIPGVQGSSAEYVVGLALLHIVKYELLPPVHLASTH